MVKKVIIIFGIMVVITISFSLSAAYFIFLSLPPLDKMTHYVPHLPTLVWSQDGYKIGEIYLEKRYPKKLSEISSVLVSAFLAAEDGSFYEHPGIDIYGLMRATLDFLSHPWQSKQGGSTITQQLAKNLLLTKERTVTRKVKDILLALEIEKVMSKDQILELYLNTLFLGNQSYGVEAAAQNYFHKTNTELTLGESSLLAGLPPAPSAYAPTEHRDKSRVRQKFVLDQMISNGLITEAEKKKALDEDIKVYKAKSPNTTESPHFFMEIKKELQEQWGLTDLETEGYQVQTTLVHSLQKSLEKRFTEELKRWDYLEGFKGAIQPSRKQDYPKETLGIVEDLLPELDAVLLRVSNGVGLLIREDHKTLLRVQRTKDSSFSDFSQLLKIGDTVAVTLKTPSLPQRFQNTKVFNESSYKGRFTLTDKEKIEASFFLMEVNTGNVLALIGGRSFNESQYNRATLSKRQLGSVVKPLYYSFAIEEGESPLSIIESPPIVFGEWKPQNYKEEVIENATIRESLIRSYNVPSIHLFQSLDPEKIHQFFQSLGYQWPKNDWSLALGSGASTLQEIVESYSPFVNQGHKQKAKWILSIKNKKGQEVFPPQKKEIPQIFSPETAYIMYSLLRDVVTFGTGNQAANLSPKIGGKTGTSNGYTDAWFVGVTPSYISGVWMGFDDFKKSLGNQGTGGSMATPLWRAMTEELLKWTPEKKELERPKGITYIPAVVTVQNKKVTLNIPVNSKKSKTTLKLAPSQKAESSLRSYL